MSIRSLGLRSDLLSMAGICQTETHPNGIIMRTPLEPDYWCGNVLIKTDQSVDPATDIAFFQARFPQSDHIKILWDIPCPDVAAVRAAFPPHFEIEAFDVLTKHGAATARSCPTGINIREIGTHSEWAASEHLAAEIAGQEGFDHDRHAPYLARRYQARKAQVSTGLGGWFGAYDGDTLVAHMGLFHDQEVIRFQAVETKSSHRRRGICAALLSQVSAWAHRRAPDAIQVIVAQADSDAGRLYRRQGFDQTERLVEATYRGY